MLADRLKELRNQKKITQTEFARMLNVANGTVGMWETGKRQPSNDMVVRLADFFGVSTDYLLGVSPFRTPMETECSIRVASLRQIIEDSSYQNRFWDDVLIGINSGHGSSGHAFTKDCLEYIKTLYKKPTLLDAECYDLSLFMYFDISWPDDFKGPVSIDLWEENWKLDVNYWAIPRIAITKGQSNISYCKFNEINNLLYFPLQHDISLDNQEKDTIAKYNGLDYHGREVVDIITDVEYRRCECVKEEATRYEIPLAGAVAAGHALQYGDVSYETVSVQNVPRGARIALTIQGESMEPTISDGSIIFLRPQEKAENGQIIIAELNGEATVCKRIWLDDMGRIVELRSDNPAYPPIKEWDSLRIIGKVLL